MTQKLTTSEGKRAPPARVTAARMITALSYLIGVAEQSGLGKIAHALTRVRGDLLATISEPSARLRSRARKRTEDGANLH